MLLPFREKNTLYIKCTKNKVSKTGGIEEITFSIPCTIIAFGSPPYKVPDASIGFGSPPYKVPDASIGIGSPPYKIPDASKGIGSPPYKVPAIRNLIGRNPFTPVFKNILKSMTLKWHT
jgi:hypothetical protein